MYTHQDTDKAGHKHRETNIRDGTKKAWSTSHTEPCGAGQWKTELEVTIDFIKPN